MAVRLDIILFGASGFTGKHAIPYIQKFANATDKPLTWGVAGRSESKIKDALQEMETRTGLDFTSIPIHIADVKDEESLKKLASNAKCIINCCGPYRFYGEEVVKACIEMGTHHVDVSGEPQYMEEMQLRYYELAKEKKIYIVSACGFDSIPTELGVIFLQNKFNGTINSIDTYLGAKEVGEHLPGPSVNYGTWESLVYGLAFAGDLRSIRTKLFPQRLPSFHPKQSRSTIHKYGNSFAIPFLGSDRSVAMRSQRYFYEVEKKRPIQIQTYMKIKSIYQMMVILFFGLVLSLLTRFEYGRKLLLDHPSFFSGGFFSREGPSEEKQENLVFSVTLQAKGWDKKITNPDETIEEEINKTMAAKVSGKNPGYGATCLTLTLAAIMILTEPDKLPKDGGVYAPGAAFAHTSLIDKLNKNGLTFEILE